MKEFCFVCELPIEGNSPSHFDIYGNVCDHCDSYLDRISYAHRKGDKKREDFLRLLFARSIVSRSFRSE